MYVRTRGESQRVRWLNVSFLLLSTNVDLVPLSVLTARLRGLNRHQAGASWHEVVHSRGRSDLFLSPVGGGDQNGKHVVTLIVTWDVIVPLPGGKGDDVKFLIIHLERPTSVEERRLTDMFPNFG